MKYLLKQNKKDKGILCDKVTIDGFDYYVSNEEIKDDDWYYWSVTNSIQKAVKDSLGRLPKSTDGSKKVIATNNPNIDISKVVNEVESILNPLYPKIQSGTYGFRRREDFREVFLIGYNKSQETHSFSEEDVRWIFAKAIELSPSTESHTRMTNDEQYRNHVLDSLYVKVLQIWKEQKPKVIYYNE